jgi:ubiquinone/menaquinone biosynthesis C-methylase UbiE
MSWLDLRRVPEPEVMDDSGEVAAYSSAAAQAYLGQIDHTFVEHAVRLLGGRSSSRNSGLALDIGSGPGQIVLKLAACLPNWQFVAVDRSLNMIRQALSGRGSAMRVEFLVADGNGLPFGGNSFDLVLCNSVLHHLAYPARLFSEIARVIKPDGAILLRDLRRPSRIAHSLHVRWHGRHYEGLMNKLYRDSVRASYTADELSAMLRASPISGAHVFTYHGTHLGIERAAG